MRVLPSRERFDENKEIRSNENGKEETGEKKKARRNKIDNKGQGRKMNKKTRAEKTLQSMKSLA